MIRFQRDSWWGQVFVNTGGIIHGLRTPVLVYAVYLLVIFCSGKVLGVNRVVSEESESLRLLGSCLSFLFIFRLNQCYFRFEAGKNHCKELFTSLHDLCGMSLGYLQGFDSGGLANVSRTPTESAEDIQKFQDMQIVVMVNIVRLVLAVAVGFKYHCRIQETLLSDGELDKECLPLVLFDYHRIKSLLYPQEHSLLDACSGLYIQDFKETLPGKPPTVHSKYFVDFNYHEVPPNCRLFGKTSVLVERENISIGTALPTVLLQVLRDVLHQPLGQKWGYGERLVNLLDSHVTCAQTAFESLDRLISNPLPLAYLQHCKVLFLVFVLYYPLHLPHELGIWANVVSPCLIFMALLGFEILADALENPLGDDTADLNVMSMIHDLEVRTQIAFVLGSRHRGRLREASMCPYEIMRHGRKGVDVNSSLLRATIPQDREMDPACSFQTHFRWMKIPPHIFVHCMQQEHGMGDGIMELLQRRHSKKRRPDTAPSESSAGSGELGHESTALLCRWCTGDNDPESAETSSFPRAEDSQWKAWPDDLTQVVRELNSDGHHTATFTHFLVLQVNASAMKRAVDILNQDFFCRLNEDEEDDVPAQLNKRKSVNFMQKGSVQVQEDEEDEDADVVEGGLQMNSSPRLSRAYTRSGQLLHRMEGW
eukprot:gnl/TRDRNA2_/TRDRNA2_185323_c0_seq1.p1 gnl/TRDRNA2_/TRDRNA2_185323_c0~~gnl/TRDRNA2_/TRDRNA2_185323_c0_seq1.p1  ORF type:complete len:651 (+),score=119.11 gnl/TRDRNA2_/TRDRNA2_185323_c0_seq1:137-2089(+)